MYEQPRLGSITIQLNEEKKLFGTLKIQYLSFGHQQVSPIGTGQTFSALDGVYNFKFTDGVQISEATFYTNATGESNAEKIFDEYEIKLLKVSLDHKSMTMTVVRLK